MMKLSKLAVAVLAIRTRLGKNQDEFARMIGTQRIAVSRWERGVAIAEPTKLMRLVNLAKTAAESEPVSAALRKQTGSNFLGAGTAEALAHELAPVLDEIEYMQGMIRDIPATRKLVDGVAAFCMVAAALIYRAERIDDSVSQILSLWLHNSSNPVAAEHFRHAAGYLAVALADEPSVGRGKGKRTRDAKTK